MTDREILARFWETPETLALLEGRWPEWWDDDGITMCRLHRILWQTPVWYVSRFRRGVEVSSKACVVSRIILAILRDHAAQRTCAAGIWVVPIAGGKYRLVNAGWDDREYASYDAALLAGLAGLAGTGKEQG